MEGKLDHGMLNVPLSKRGNIDSQIDAYKAKQAAEAKRFHKERAAEARVFKAEAKTALAAFLANTDLVNQQVAKFGVTRKQFVSNLESMSKWEPKKLIAILNTISNIERRAA